MSFVFSGKCGNYCDDWNVERWFDLEMAPSNDLNR